MRLALRIARRYLFAKRSTNAINVITGISVFGIAVGSAALVLVLSVFNGFDDLISAMYTTFNPDVRITVSRGKSFVPDSTMLARIRAVEGVAHVSQTLEEVAFFQYKNREDFGILKGVDGQYLNVNPLDSMVREGIFRTREGGNDFAVLGFGMRNKLGVDITDLFTDLSVYLPKNREVGPFEDPFRRRSIYPAGSFFIQQEYDNQYVITSLDFAREMLAAPGAVSALELKLFPGFRPENVAGRLQELLGPDFEVKDRYAQQEAFMRLMKLEKWMSYAIVSLMMLLVAFNMIGALWMIVLEKKHDIAILKSMGASNEVVRNIFLAEGVLLSLLGIAMGFLLALLLYFLQKQYSLISIPGSFMVSAYPISIRWSDFLVVALTVLTIGLLASTPPALRARRVPALIREE